MFPNWFTAYADKYFSTYLAALVYRENLRFLQLGAFTGDASRWLCGNILVGPGAELVDVDTWQGSDEPEHEKFDWAEVERRYDEQTAQFTADGTIIKFKGRTVDYLTTADGPFDFIYVDADHTSPAVLTDAVLAIPLLAHGGLIAFDDYLWKSADGHRQHAPGPAIDAIRDIYEDQLELIAIGSQVWFRRR